MHCLFTTRVIKNGVCLHLCCSSALVQLGGIISIFLNENCNLLICMTPRLALLSPLYTRISTWCENKNYSIIRAQRTMVVQMVVVVFRTVL